MRDEAERTVVLTEAMADAVNAEVDNGKHDTYEDALEYVLARGFAEIKRARDSQQKAAEAKKLRDARESLNKLLGDKPTLALDPEFMANMMKTLGINLPAAEAKTAKVA